MAVHKNQVIWQPILNIIINIDTSKLSNDAQNVNWELVFMYVQEGQDKPNTGSNNGVDAEQEMSEEQTQMHNMTTDNKEKSESIILMSPTVFPINAWKTVELIVLEHHSDSAVLKLGQAVFAAAIRCEVFSIILIMINILKGSVNNEDIKLLHLSFQEYMINYLDKINELTEMLKIDVKIYEEWQSVINCIDDTNDDHIYALDMAKINNFFNLVFNNIFTSCQKPLLSDWVCDFFNATPEYLIQRPLEIQIYYCRSALEQLLKHLSAV